MPQPLTHWQNRGTYWSANTLQERPECALGVASVASTWAFLEFWLVSMFFAATGEIEITDDGRPEFIGHQLATAALGALESTSAKLDVIAAGLDMYIPSVCAQFEQLRIEIRKCARERNRIVHAVWGVNKRYSKAVIRVETFNAANIKYTAKDFADTVERVKRQIKKVEEFDAVCREIRLEKHAQEQAAQEPQPQPQPAEVEDPIPD